MITPFTTVTILVRRDFGYTLPFIVTQRRISCHGMPFFQLRYALLCHIKGHFVVLKASPSV